MGVKRYMKKLDESLSVVLILFSGFVLALFTCSTLGYPLAASAITYWIVVAAQVFLTLDFTEE